MTIKTLIYLYKNYRNVVEIDFLFSNENTIWEQGVAGSNPATPTKFEYPYIFSKLVL